MEDRYSWFTVALVAASIASAALGADSDPSGRGAPAMAGAAGACCFDDGTCQVIGETDCNGAGGVYQGEGTDCTPGLCPAPGACCFPDGSCEDGVAARVCEGMGGTYQGSGSLCGDVECPGVGACCLPDDTCAPDPEEGTPVLVENAGFEADILADGDFQLDVTDWIGTGVSGIYNPTTEQYPGEAPEGENVAFCRGGSLYQTLDEVVVVGTTYTLEVEVGRRLDSDFSGYRVQLIAAGAVLAEDNNTLLPDPGTFVTSVVAYTSPPDDPQLGYPLRIRLVCPAGGLTQSNFDDVRLTAMTAGGLPPAECDALGGVYQGDGTTCADVVCGDPVGACCLPTDDCVDGLTALECGGQGGEYQGGGTICEDVMCGDPVGACCLPTDDCVDGLTALECSDQGGEYQGDGTICEDVMCGDPVGACCLPTDDCVDGLTALECSGQGGEYQGDGTICEDVMCGENEPVCAVEGTLIEGSGETNDFNATCGSDDSYWAVHGEVFAFQVSDPVSQFELIATAPAGFGGNSISVDIEASKQNDQGSLFLRARLFNFTTGSYVVLPGGLSLTTADQIQTFELPAGSDPVDFVEPGTDKVQLLLQTIQTTGLPTTRTQLDEVLFFFE